MLIVPKQEPWGLVKANLLDHLVSYLNSTYLVLSDCFCLVAVLLQLACCVSLCKSCNDKGEENCTS
jgi:hypothetical protein